MIIHTYKIPEDLEKIIGTYQVVQERKGRIGDDIITLADQNKELFYLKIAGTSESREALKREREILKWIRQKSIRIPKVLFYRDNQQNGYLLQSCVLGEPAHRVLDVNRKELVRACVNILRKLHRLDCADLSGDYQRVVNHELTKIRIDLENGIINTDQFAAANGGLTAQDAYQYLLKHQNILQENTFTHGDFCLPNIIIRNRNEYGVIDWSKAGVGDPYRDIAAIMKSIKRNFGEGLMEYFKEYYGITDVDQEKVYFYELVDQFSYCQSR